MLVSEVQKWLPLLSNDAYVGYLLPLVSCKGTEKASLQGLPATASPLKFFFFFFIQSWVPVG